MSFIKKGIHFPSQDTDAPMILEEVPLIVDSLTPKGLFWAALVGFAFMQTQGYSLNKALEFMGGKQKESAK